VNSSELVGDRPSSHSVVCFPVHRLERNNRTAVVNLLRCIRFGGRSVDWRLSLELVSKGSGHRYYCQDYCTLLPFYFTGVSYIFVVFMLMDFMSPGVLSECGHARMYRPTTSGQRRCVRIKEGGMVDFCRVEARAPAHSMHRYVPGLRLEMVPYPNFEPPRGPHPLTVLLSFPCLTCILC
jgi:hypothetical protein